MHREQREFATELKFIITPELAEKVKSFIGDRLALDPFTQDTVRGTYQISSLYFDTEQFDVFQKNGSFARSKFRVRRYGASQMVYFERKLKSGGVLTKRRSLHELKNLRLLSLPLVRGEAQGKWFHRRLLARRLKPVCQITYQRHARIALTENGPIRLTLDESLKGTSIERIGFADHIWEQPLLEGKVVMEMKFLRDLPFLFKSIITELGLNPQAMSKYRHAVHVLNLAPADVTAAVAEQRKEVQYV